MPGEVESGDGESVPNCVFLLFERIRQTIYFSTLGFSFNRFSHRQKFTMVPYPFKKDTLVFQFNYFFLHFQFSNFEALVASSCPKTCSRVVTSAENYFGSELPQFLIHKC